MLPKRARIPLRDGYGNVVSGKRLRGCQCKPVPCAGFRCRSRHHKGNRLSPWCVGGSEKGYEHSCSDCWYAEEKRKGNIT